MPHILMLFQCFSVHCNYHEYDSCNVCQNHGTFACGDTKSQMPKLHRYKHREENQLDATECFIAIIICSICFAHSYAHHQELETILVLLPHMVCNALVAGSLLFGVEQQAKCPG